MGFLIFRILPLVACVAADIRVNDGSASYTVRISTWWVPRLWTSWINCCDMTIRPDWRRGRPWSIPTSVSCSSLPIYFSPASEFFSLHAVNLTPLSISSPSPSSLLHTSDPVVKDQSRMVGSANVPALNTAVSTATLITGKNRKWGHAEPLLSLPPLITQIQDKPWDSLSPFSHLDHTGDAVMKCPH